MGSLFDWSSTASSNTTVDGINVNTGMPVSNVDNAIRSLMALIRQSFSATLQNFLSGASALGISSGGTGSTTAADARTALGLGSVATESTVPVAKGGTGATTAATALAALMGSALSGSASAGTINFGVLKLTWKDVTANGNTATAMTYHSAFSSWSRAWCNGGNPSSIAQDNNPFVQSGTESTTGCTVYNSENGPIATTVFAIGV